MANMSHFVAYILQFQEIIVYEIPLMGGGGSLASLRSSMVAEKETVKRFPGSTKIKDCSPPQAPRGRPEKHEYRCIKRWQAKRPALFSRKEMNMMLDRTELTKRHNRNNYRLTQRHHRNQLQANTKAPQKSISG